MVFDLRLEPFTDASLLSSYNGSSVVTLDDIPVWPDLYETFEESAGTSILNWEPKPILLGDEPDLFCLLDLDREKQLLKKQFVKFDAQAVEMVAKMADLEGRKDSKSQMGLMSLQNNDWRDTDLSVTFEQDNLDFVPDMEINRKISLWRGDITTLEIDAIVNAANMAMRGGGGIDGRIHSVAGPTLLEECIELNGCPCGRTKTTRGHNLLCKYILHTVGPRVTNDKHPLPHTNLTGCYSSILDLVRKHKIRSVAFCCISTGIFGYPLEMATHAALTTVRNWLAIPENSASVDRIIFCVYNPPDLDIYERLLQLYFPIASDDERGVGITVPSAKKSSPTVTAFAEPASITDAATLVEAIRNARQLKGESAGETPMDLSGLEELIASLDKDARKSFFKKTVPTILDLAARRKELLSGSEVELLLQVSKSESKITGTQIACLLACAFLTIMPKQKMHHQAFVKLSMEDLWTRFSPAAAAASNGDASSSSEDPSDDASGSDEAPKPKSKTQGSNPAVKANAFARFQALIHYFDNLKRSDDVRTFYRQTAVAGKDSIDWLRVKNKPIPIHSVDAPLNSAPAPQITLLPVNPLMAHTWFGHTATFSQTDAFVWSNPELLVLALITPRLLTTEIAQAKRLQSGLPLSLSNEGQLQVGKTSADSIVSHVVFVPQLEVSLPRHARARFYVTSLLNGLVNALRSIPDPLKIAASNWLGGPNAGDTSTTNLFLSLAITYFELMLVLGDDAVKMNKKRPDRAAKCPELFLYSSGPLAADLTALFDVVERQEVSYDILLAAATGKPILNTPLNGNGPILNQLAVRFSTWKKEFKAYQKEQDKIRRAKEKEIEKAAAIRQKEREAAMKEREAAIKVARKAAEQERADAKKAAAAKAKAASQGKHSRRSSESSEASGSVPSHRVSYPASSASSEDDDDED